MTIDETNAAPISINQSSGSSIPDLPDSPKAGADAQFDLSSKLDNNRANKRPLRKRTNKGFNAKPGPPPGAPPTPTKPPEPEPPKPKKEGFDRGDAITITGNCTKGSTDYKGKNGIVEKIFKTPTKLIKKVPCYRVRVIMDVKRGREVKKTADFYSDA